MDTKIHTMVVLALLFSRLTSATAGIVGHWQFEEGSGATAADSSGNGHDASFEGAPKWVSPGWNGAGWCVQLGGSDDRLTVEPFDVEGSGITLAAWIRPATFNDDARVVSKAQGGNTSDHYWAMVLSGGGENNLEFRLRTDVGGASRYTTADAYELEAGEWTHVAVTWDADDPFMRQYKNAEEIRRDSKAGRAVGTNPAVKIGIGNQSISVPADSRVRPFGGLVDEVLVVDRGLTQGQITDLMSGVLPNWSRATEPNPADGATDVTTPLLQWTPGETAVLHDVYLGTDPNLGPDDLAQGRTPAPMYYHTLGLTPGTTYYWRVDEIEADMTTVHTGAVWTFLAKPWTAYLPDPADGTNEVPPDPNMTLIWQPGKNAVKHQLYFGGSFDDVNDGAPNADKGTLTETTVVLPEPLDSLTVYYWRVDEIGIDGTVQAGPVWSFSTFKMADDFESYTDDMNGGQAIFQTWIDGVENGTGSYVGYDVASNGTFGETTIVHSGGQSMPLEYSNVDPPHYSETSRTFGVPQDWTVNGADMLILYFRGDSANAEDSLYVVLEDNAGRKGTATHANPAAVLAISWQKWSIPLSDFAAGGVNLKMVKKMYIGLGNRSNPAPGGAGLIYIDDIRVTRP